MSDKQRFRPIATAWLACRHSAIASLPAWGASACSRSCLCGTWPISCDGTRAPIKPPGSVRFADGRESCGAIRPAIWLFVDEDRMSNRRMKRHAVGTETDRNWGAGWPALGLCEGRRNHQAASIPSPEQQVFPSPQPSTHSFMLQRKRVVDLLLQASVSSLYAFARPAIRFALSPQRANRRTRLKNASACPSLFFACREDICKSHLKQLRSEAAADERRY